MSRKRKKALFHSWENKKQEDGYVRLGFSLLDSDAFRDLSGNAVKLYVYMREWAYRKEKSNGEYLIYTLTLAKNILGVSEPTANKALLELESKGFIQRQNNSKAMREATRWKFIDEWYKKE